MQDNLKVTVNNEFQFDIHPSEIAKLDILKLPKNNFHILKNNQSFKSKLVEANFNNRTYQIEVNGNKYSVKIEGKIDGLIKTLGFSIGNTKKSNEIKAPMPGLILNIQVKEGQEVKEGEVLLILEAMKMENAITAQKNGVVKLINASIGTTVDKGALLIEMD